MKKLLPLPQSPNSPTDSGGSAPLGQAAATLFAAEPMMRAGAVIAARVFLALLPKLREIHRLAHEELPVIPLWQLADHFAYHRDVKGIGASCASLYQNIEE